MRAVLARVVAQLYPEATIVEASNGAEALSALARQRPDLIISDYRMPMIDGLELVRTLRAKGASMPILALFSDASIAEAMLAAGATAVLAKPFHLHALRVLLTTLLPSGEETQAVGE